MVRCESNVNHILDLPFVCINILSISRSQTVLFCKCYYHGSSGILFKWKISAQLQAESQKLNFMWAIIKGFVGFKKGSPYIVTTRSYPVIQVAGKARNEVTSNWST